MDTDDKLAERDPEMAALFGSGGPLARAFDGYRVREALEQPLRVAGFDIYPTVSIGAVMVEGGPDAPDAAELLRRVELAVESAKGAGRGGSAAYGRALESDSLSRLALEADLRNAFVRGEIGPFFQPIVNLKTGAVAGFEAKVAAAREAAASDGTGRRDPAADQERARAAARGMARTKGVRW